VLPAAASGPDCLEYLSKRLMHYLVRSEFRSALALKGLRSPAARAVATVLAEARKSRGLTQRDLAERVRRPHSVIGMIETEQRQVTIPEFIALAEALEKDPGELFRLVLKGRHG
jgi:DNA-binding XRE family transcriptional regulator